MVAGSREKLNTPVLDHFSISWINISFKLKTGLSVPNIQAHSDDQGGKCSSFRDFFPFITNTGDISRANNLNLLGLLSNPTKSTQYETGYFCRFFFVKATYNLEGDTPLALLHVNISFVSSFTTTADYTVTAAICT